ncbi:MAG TPA: hypothetical protein VM260_07390 [Pirellula sp.]|nr:hypothetical protein [Pirellula sp.]
MVILRISIIIMHLFNRQRQSNLFCSRTIVYLLNGGTQIQPAISFGFVLVLSLQAELLGQKQEGALLNSNTTVSMLSGPPVVGSLVSADSRNVVVKTENGVIEMLAADIGQVNFINKRHEKSPPVELFMMDGSRAFGERLTGKSSDGWQLSDSIGNEVEIPSKSLKAARLKAILPEIANAWQSAIRETTNADAVIVLRPGNSLDRINGVIVQVQETSITFDLDGQQIDIPIEKLVGLTWFQRELQRVRPTIEVRMTDHSVWMAESLSLKPNVLELRTPLGQSVSIPIAKILSINYSTANIKWLSEVESLEVVTVRQIDFKTPIASLDRAFAPRFVVNGRAPLPTSLAADKDLYFPSPGHYVFRAPEGFSSFQCRIERTDDGSQRSDLNIEVWQDDQRISEQLLLHTADFVDLDIPLKPEKKTKLAVICRSKLMIGTEVTWKQPRLKR